MDVPFLHARQACLIASAANRIIRRHEPITEEMKTTLRNGMISDFEREVAAEIFKQLESDAKCPPATDAEKAAAILIDWSVRPAPARRRRIT